MNSIPNAILKCAKIEWQGTLPFSKDFNDIYFSREDGIEESYYTFIEGNHLPARWRDFNNSGNYSQAPASFSICEIGFGTGLNFLSTANFWRTFKTSSADTHTKPWLDYFSIENSPLKFSDINRTLKAWPQFSTFARGLLKHYPLPLKGHWALYFNEHRIRLHLLWMDVREAFAHLVGQNQLIDAFYLDGFAPAKNPQAWHDDVFLGMGKLSSDKTTFATFSAAGDVRRGLMQHCFTVSKRAGFGTKRDMLVGEYQTKNPAQQPKCRVARRLPKTVAIIGAGIAGCSTARMLAESGCRVTLYEQSQTIASGASGSSSGIYYPYLTSDISVTAQYFLHGYFYTLYAIDRFNLHDCVKSIGVRLDGLPDKKLAAIARWLDAEPELSRWINLKKRDQVIFPHSGYFDLKRVCERLTEHKNIELQLSNRVSSVTHVNDKITRDSINALARWTVVSNRGHNRYDAVVICNSYSVSSLLPDNFYPAVKARGQTALFYSSEIRARLSTVLCDSVYAIPKGDDTIYGGATFELDNHNPKPDSSSHKKLIADLSRLLNIDLSPLKSQYGRVGFRSCSIDRMPYVGQVSDHPLTIQHLNTLHHGRDDTNRVGRHYFPGLYINVAHGARGILSSFASAQLIESLVCQRFCTLPANIQKHLDPDRQLLKELKKPPSQRVDFFSKHSSPRN